MQTLNLNRLKYCEHKFAIADMIFQFKKHDDPYHFDIKTGHVDISRMPNGDLYIEYKETSSNTCFLCTYRANAARHWFEYVAIVRPSKTA